MCNKLQNMKERYNEYISNEKVLWANRFIWKGLSGEMSIPEISITNYFKESSNTFNNVVNKVKNFYNEVKEESIKYAQWCKSKIINLSDIEIDSLQKFFLGAIGEFFFLHFLNEVKSIYIKNSSGYSENFTFSFIHTLLANERDGGVDLCALCKHDKVEKNCVIQVKFWNPKIAYPLPYSMATKAYYQGTKFDLIDKDEDKNIVICWLGCDKKVSKFLKEDPLYKNQLLFIDMPILNKTISNQAELSFWSTLYDKLWNIKNL